MADLITNLQSIYNTKLQIKEAIGTESDIFADYPTYISDLKPSGYTYITTNGDYDVSAYSDVNVNVPQGGAAVLGNLSVTENGQYSASSYSYDGFDVVDVNVPTVTPVLNSLSVSANGVYTPQTGVDGYNEVTVNVPTSGSSHSGDSVEDAWSVDEAISYIQNAGTETVTAQKYVKGFVSQVQYTFSAQHPTCRVYIKDDPDGTGAELYLRNFYSEDVLKGGLTAWDADTCKQIQIGDFIVAQGTQYVYYQGTTPQMMQGNLIWHKKTATGQLTVSQSGTYDVQNYVSAYVNVSGGSTPTMSVSGQYGVYNSKYYIYDNNTYLTFNGPIANVNLGDTVSGTAEYVDFDGSGDRSSYLFKNFTVGSTIPDPNRVYTNFTVGSYYNNRQTLISPINGGVNSQSIEFYSSDVMKTAYSLPSNYSGPQIETDSTVYCYVSTTNAMAMTQYLINEVVSVINPTLTGMSYSTDNGMTWNSMSYDSLTGSYSVSGLSKSISAGSNDNSIYIRQEFDNASYKYVSPYIEFNSGSTSPIQTMVTPNTMMSAIKFYNMTGAAKEITGLDYNVNSTYLSVSFQQGVEYSYRIVATDSTGAPTGNKYAMTNDPAMGWRYNNWYNENIEYFYIEKFIVGESTGIENYKPSTNVTMDSSTGYPVSTANTGLFHLTESAKNQIIFNVNNMTVNYNKMNFISLRDSNNTEICKVYSMDVGTTFNNATSVSGCYFTDAGGAMTYKPSENISISSTYDGSINVGTANSGTISFDAGNYNLYYWDAAIGNEKGVFIHGITTA